MPVERPSWRREGRVDHISCSSPTSGLERNRRHVIVDAVGVRYTATSENRDPVAHGHPVGAIVGMFGHLSTGVVLHAGMPAQVEIVPELMNRGQSGLRELHARDGQAQGSSARSATRERPRIPVRP